MEKLNQIHKNFNDISQKLQILKAFLTSNLNEKFEYHKEQFYKLSREFESSSGKNKRYLQDLNSTIDLLLENIINIVSQEMKNELFAKADLLIQKTQKFSIKNKEYFIEKLNELKLKIQNENALKQIIDNFENLENLNNRINFEINNQKSFFQKVIGVMSKTTKALSDGIFSIPKGLIEIDPNIKTYFVFALSMLNIGATSARAINNIRNERNNYLMTLPEITMFTRMQSNQRFSLKAFDDDSLNIEIIPGLSLKEIFQSFGNSDYLTDDNEFNQNKYKVKIDHSVHENIISIVLIFPEKIEYKKSEFTQTFQFIGQLNANVYKPIPYGTTNSVICTGNSKDFCVVDKLNGLDLSSMKDYRHQVVFDKKNISAIHSYENERKITYVNGHSRETNIDIYGNVGIDRFSINSISYASNSTNTLPIIYVDEQNKQVIINGFGNNRCFDFSLNSKECIDIGTTIGHQTPTSTTSSTSTTSNVVPTSDTTQSSSVSTAANIGTTKQDTTSINTTSSSATSRIIYPTTTPKTSQYTSSTNVNHNSTSSTAVYPTTGATNTIAIPTDKSTPSYATTQQQISVSTNLFTSDKITSTGSALGNSTTTTQIPFTTKTLSDNSSTSTILTTLSNSTIDTTNSYNSNSTKSPEENKNNALMNPLLWIIPTALLGLLILSAISYFSIQAIRRRNYNDVGSSDNGSVNGAKFGGSDTQSDDSITVLNMQNHYGTPSMNSSAPVFAPDQQRRKNEENQTTKPKNNSWWNVFSRKKKIDSDIEMDRIDWETAVTTVSGSVSANQTEYSNLDSPTTSRKANQETTLNQANQNRKELFKTTSSTTIEVKSATPSKKEIDRLRKENKEYQNFVQLFIKALEARISLKNGNLNELKLPDCSQIMTSKNNNLSKQYYVENAFKYDSFYALFPGDELFCQDAHEIERLFNEIYKIETNNKQKILNGKMKSEILDDLYILLFDQGNKWYETEIFKNNQENKLMDALNRMKGKLERKEKDLNQQNPVSTSIV